MIAPAFTQPHRHRHNALVCALILGLANTAGFAQEQADPRPTAPVIEEVLHTASPEYQQAQALIEQKDYASAVKLLTPLAERGDPAAQAQLGELYQQGHGVPKNTTKAFDLYKRSAEQGHAPAMYALGVMYETGQAPAPNPITQLLINAWMGKPRDLEREAQEARNREMESALQWYTQAADNGHEDAMRALVRLYKGSDKRIANTQKALQWIRALAERGDAQAQFDMGKSYDNDGVQNYAMAMSWYMGAQEQGHTGAMNNIGNLHFYGRGTAKDPSRAWQWYQKAAALNNLDAQNNLGLLAWSGEGTKKNLKQAESWFNLAAANGHASASTHLRQLARSWHAKRLSSKCSTNKRRTRPEATAVPRFRTIYWMRLVPSLAQVLWWQAFTA